MDQTEPIYTLYTYFRSSTAWRVRILLNLKAIPHDFVFIHLLKKEQKDSKYLQINPNAAVPSLKLKNGQILIESMAICEYLQQVHGEPSVLPKDPLLKAKIRGFCEVINSGLHPYQNLRLLEKIQNDYKGDKIAFAREWVVRGFALLQKMLSSTHGKFCFGDEITLADAFFAPQVQGGSTRFNISLDDYPISKQILDNLKCLSAFEKAEPKNQPDFQK